MSPCWPLVTLACLVAWPQPGEPARILGLFPYKGASHFFVFRPLLEELARRGHSVTVASHIPRLESLHNYTDISLEDMEDPSLGFVDFKQFEEMESSYFTNLMGLQFLGAGYERALAKPQVLALANSSFDLVITELFNSDLFMGLAYKIGAPVIGFSSCYMLPWSSDASASPNDLPYIPQLLGTHGPNMGFFDRIRNAVELWISRAFYRFVIHPNAQAIAEKYLGPLPDLADIAANTSLFLVNSHFTLLGHRPITPSVIDVGGINVLKPKPLPQDLEKIFNDSKGVIYFSMGSVLKGTSMPAEKVNMFVKAFLASGRTVLWKREEALPQKHPNIITRPWFPQRDILAHPKTELIIAHCGLLGLNEAVTSGVPVICIPMFGDQITNAKFASENGMGLRLRYATLSEATIRSALSEVLNNKKFSKRASEISRAFNDRPMSPLDTAVYWTEYLLRHGPGIFNDPAKQMPVWQRLGYDIFAAILGAVALVVTAIWLIIRMACGGKREAKKLKQN